MSRRALWSSSRGVSRGHVTGGTHECHCSRRADRRPDDGCGARGAKEAPPPRHQDGRPAAALCRCGPLPAAAALCLAAAALCWPPRPSAWLPRPSAGCRGPLPAAAALCLPPPRPSACCRGPLDDDDDRRTIRSTSSRASRASSAPSRASSAGRYRSVPHSDLTLTSLHSLSLLKYLTLTSLANLHTSKRAKSTRPPHTHIRSILSVLCSFVTDQLHNLHMLYFVYLRVRDRASQYRRLRATGAPPPCAPTDQSDHRPPLVSLTTARATNTHSPVLRSRH